MGYIITIVILLAFSAFFSASETAFSTVNKIRLKNYAATGDKKAERALKIANKFDTTLTAILVGNNIVNIVSASLCTMAFTKLMGEEYIPLGTAVMTVAVLIFGEILPKTLAKENAEKISLAFAGFLNFIMLILTPATWVFSHLQRLANRMFSSDKSEPSVTEDELKYIIEEIEDEGVLEEQESDLVRSALEFDEIVISEILIPRVNVTAVEISQPIESIRDLFLNDGYSRLPVYEKTIDNIVGVIRQKDFFGLMVEGGADIRGIITEPLYISEFKLISEVLHEMQRTKNHMAIVMDQYGGTLGIVTLEDIIEELVGEIYDETDEVVTSLSKIGDDEYEISAELSISDMLEELDLPEDIIDGSSTSVGGWAMELFEKIPAKGDEITEGIFTLRIVEVEEQTVKKIHLKVDRGEEEEE